MKPQKNNMPRPRGSRRICYRPDVLYFKPRGVPMSQLEELVIRDDELEALRLADADGSGQVKAAKQMGISQPTFARVLATARHKLAKAVVNGMAIRLENSKRP